MGAATVQGEVEGVRGSHHRARAVADDPCGQWPDVLAQHDLGPGEPLEESVVDHPACADGEFLSRLEHHQQCAAPLVTRPREQHGGTGQAGGVHVVTAGVHHRYVAALVVHASHLAGVGKSGLLLHRQRVEVRAEHDHRPLAVAQYPDHAGDADSLGHLVEARLAQALRQKTGGACLLERELGISVQILVEGGEFIADLRQLRGHRLRHGYLTSLSTDVRTVTPHARDACRPLAGSADRRTSNGGRAGSV